jgi:hypothetical protein
MGKHVLLFREHQLEHQKTKGLKSTVTNNMDVKELQSEQKASHSLVLSLLEVLIDHRSQYQSDPIFRGHISKVTTPT